MYRFLIIGVWLLGMIFPSSAQEVQLTAQPEWATYPNIALQKDRGTLPGEGVRYLLYDKQINLLARESYHRFSIQVLSADGIQAISDLQIEFDPTFQTLEIHAVKLYRDGANIYSLNVSDIKLIQKEAGADRHVYDGAMTALLHLSGVQKNDIIDYSYSLKGFNPVYGNDYSGFLIHQLDAKVEQFHYQIMVPSSRRLQIQEKGHAFLPIKTSSAGVDTYTWSHAAMDAISFDANVPYWSALYPMTSFSTFADWKAVVDWSLPLYSYSDQEVEKIKKSLPETRENISRITALVRYVQDDIRYLGLEAGMSAYRPNSPEKVFEQKLGTVRTSLCCWFHFCEARASRPIPYW